MPGSFLATRGIVVGLVFLTCERAGERASALPGLMTDCLLRAWLQTSEFLDALQPPHVVLVHGEATEMGRLKKALEQHAAALGIPRAVYMPKVTQPVLIAHRAQRTAKLVGRLAEKPPREGQPVQGLLVKRGGTHTVLHHDDLPKFTKLHPGRVLQRQAVALHRPVAEVRAAGKEAAALLGGGGRRAGGGARRSCFHSWQPRAPSERLQAPC